MKKAIIFLTIITVMFTIFTPMSSLAKMTGNQRTTLIRAIDQSANKTKLITREEAGILRSIVNMGYGYSELLNDYLKSYKGKEGMGMEKFMQHVYDGTLPRKK